MEYAVIIILLALLQYTYFSISAGIKRDTYEVEAPMISGNEIWQRHFRVQQNTLEQLIIFIPGMLAFSVYVSATWVVLPGVVFLVSRQLYAYLYVKEPKSRAPGFVPSFLSSMVLVFGSLIGIGIKLVT